eukprot:TRINITY_DN1719_c0_g1_i2.p1 TRINITY_DN1719_c0_g1~~TRINITY_DN1719_c0_g1_i2.p1  ORF type:complete len:131 (-),score=18.81 TRINITY_DN1719_c0_g1_i2:17-409(-)
MKLVLKNKPKRCNRVARNVSQKLRNSGGSMFGNACQRGYFAHNKSPLQFYSDRLHLIRSKKGFICDMDGVVYRGNSLVNGVHSFMEWIKDTDKNLLFLTNTSSASQASLQQKLMKMVRFLFLILTTMYIN